MPVGEDLIRIDGLNLGKIFKPSAGGPHWAMIFHS